MLGYPVLSLEPTAAAVRAARERPERPLLAFTRVAVDNVATVHELLEQGMLPVEVALTLARATGDDGPPTRTDAVGPLREGDEDAVVEIAGRGLRSSRFHLDPRIPDRDAERLKREWTRNCARGERGLEVLVARQEGEVAGFLAMGAGSYRGELARVVDLIAVAERWQAQGLGRALVSAFVARHQSEVPWLTVGTQAGNHASLALYAACGFRVARSEHVLHLHLKR